MLRTRNLSKFSATSDVQYQVNQVPRCAAWQTDMKKANLNWKLEISNTPDNADIITLTSLSRRHVTLGVVECRK